MSEFKDIKFTCPQCEKHLAIDAKGAGFIVTCPDCHTQMTVPKESGEPAHAYVPSPPASRDATDAGPNEVEGRKSNESGIDTDLVPGHSTNMLLHNAFNAFSGGNLLSPETQFVIQTIGTDHRPETKLKTLHAAEQRFGKGYRRRQLQEMVDLVLFFLRWCIEDHKITAAETEALNELRIMLDIHDGDLYRERKDAIRALLERQIDWMEEDFQITYAEELYLVDLQRIFDLSYDQLLELSRPHVAEILDNLFLQLAIVHNPSIRIQIDQLLKSFCMLKYRPFEIAKEKVEEVAGRMIPQSIKDSVWRRDGGKCTTCGSKEFLEFDHIIPFSLGGSNTYRNVQLLCKSCNRKKSSRIG